MQPPPASGAFQHWDKPFFPLHLTKLGSPKPKENKNRGEREGYQGTSARRGGNPHRPGRRTSRGSRAGPSRAAASPPAPQSDPTAAASERRRPGPKGMEMLVTGRRPVTQPQAAGGGEGAGEGRPGREGAYRSYSERVRNMAASGKGSAGGIPGRGNRAAEAGAPLCPRRVLLRRFRPAGPHRAGAAPPLPVPRTAFPLGYTPPSSQ